MQWEEVLRAEQGFANLLERHGESAVAKYRAMWDKGEGGKAKVLERITKHSKKQKEKKEQLRPPPLPPALEGELAAGADDSESACASGEASDAPTSADAKEDPVSGGEEAEPDGDRDSRNPLGSWLSSNAVSFLPPPDGGAGVRRDDGKQTSAELFDVDAAVRTAEGAALRECGETRKVGIATPLPPSPAAAPPAAALLHHSYLAAAAAMPPVAAGAAEGVDMVTHRGWGHTALTRSLEVVRRLGLAEEEENGAVDAILRGDTGTLTLIAVYGMGPRLHSHLSRRFARPPPAVDAPPPACAGGGTAAAAGGGADGWQSAAGDHGNGGDGDAVREAARAAVDAGGGGLAVTPP